MCTYIYILYSITYNICIWYRYTIDQLGSLAVQP